MFSFTKATIDNNIENAYFWCVLFLLLEHSTYRLASLDHFVDVRVKVIRMTVYVKSILIG